MFWKLLLAFTVIPTVELYLLISIGQLIGPLATVGLILSTGIIGAALTRREGLAVVSTLRADLEKGLPPADHLVEGGLVVAGGLLLITPGVLTDITGFALVQPFTRRRLAPPLKRWLLQRFKLHAFEGRIGAPRPVASSAAAEPDAPADSPFEHPVR